MLLGFGAFRKDVCFCPWRFAAMKKFLTFLIALAWLLGFIAPAPAAAQYGSVIEGATFSSGPVTVTAWGFRSDILFVDMDVHVEGSAAVWVQTGQVEGCLTETTSVGSGAMLSGGPMIWLPVKSECFAEPARFLLKDGGDIHLSFQAQSFYSLTVWWVSEGVSGIIPVFQEDFSWSPPRDTQGPSTTPTQPVLVTSTSPRVWVEVTDLSEATYYVRWACDGRPRIIEVQVNETGPYTGATVGLVPFEMKWVTIISDGDKEEERLPCSGRLPIYSVNASFSSGANLSSRWVVVVALQEDGVLVSSEPFLFEPTAPKVSTGPFFTTPPTPTAVR
ncbi:MAG: hypothetical protein A3F33_00175 [Candidatus Woykebacteria bacterium RIFCSPHIGHO2_12_FULL_43_10]|uniref:Uncharacterized protein n=2 Tax=Candidatus Woykeibacteriota TaxID=1817899 RepID=A0A1G1WXJ1_9BACT|nr:MAG: hypothetical protein A2802_02075 [Candidatus Woykebacteria bacterium RIFCSPHIGHO2_01_FULL_43_29]OGY28844.1 MAG: hypothetical protein A3F33_00175 [Candidatus Woykebacteria bacterium RIFCSPHIGHO2_12_FULL_43_10]OGY30205.1 MAG: hypothetical protein A3J50_02005 [Candidatus Woykebacteria bacterium RIFCSPHIGHO2_02_FULL_43_16b]OGY31867.1 MAG: hypothetical protein A3A61_03070 [Candidatus Woykebacteria bacterium RIFCSPLOWO2_01_FULL_43_14]